LLYRRDVMMPNLVEQCDGDQYSNTFLLQIWYYDRLFYLSCSWDRKNMGSIVCSYAVAKMVCRTGWTERGCT